ncbi:MAG TPA: response regulator [Stellaceae bacterium]|nr:response regulator [Stellaceae bacterium]
MEKRATILVVEDDDDIRDMVAEILEDYGYRVLCAQNADAALAILRRDRDIDLMFTDIIMPGHLNGVDLAQAALDIQPHLKLLFASGYASQAVLAPLQDRLSSAFISKPYRPRELAARIAALLDE